MAHGKGSFHIPAARTPEEIDDLKRSWKSDPIWDIEETEGFEAHRSELLNYRLEEEKKWKEIYQEEIVGYAVRIGIPDNIKLAEYIRNLERRIAKLEEGD